MTSKRENTLNKNSIALSYDEFKKLFSEMQPQMSAKEELEEYNIVKECEGIKKLKKAGAKLSKYSQGLYLVCEYIIECTKHDPENGNYYSEDNKKKIVEAGKLLNEDDGTAAMHQVIDLWVPKRYQREIDGMWDGIGDWCA